MGSNSAHFGAGPGPLLSFPCISGVNTVLLLGCQHPHLPFLFFFFWRAKQKLLVKLKRKYPDVCVFNLWFFFCFLLSLISGLLRTAAETPAAVLAVMGSWRWCVPGSCWGLLLGRRLLGSHCALSGASPEYWSCWVSTQLF